MNDISHDELQNKCFERAQLLLQGGYPVGNIDLFELTDLLVKLELEKIEKNQITDANISYNDEIVSIEPMENLETVDISVSGDNLFYCNGILTKNSFGLPATADFMIALISGEDLESLGQVMIKQLKNRYSDISKMKRFVVGIDRSMMKLYDTESESQTLTNEPESSVPVSPKSNRRKW